MIKPEYLYSELTGKIIGSAMEVHNYLGNGFQEVIYQRALAYEMELSQIQFTREVEMPIFYKQKDIGTRRVDFLVNEKICVELKALTKLEPRSFSPSNKLSRSFQFRSRAIDQLREYQT